MVQETDGMSKETDKNRQFLYFLLPIMGTLTIFSKLSVIFAEIEN